MLADFKKLYSKRVSKFKDRPINKYVFIMTDLFFEIQTMLIKETQHFSMPNAFGSIQIIAIKNKAAVDLKNYHTTGIAKKLSNLHSNKDIYAFRWVFSPYERFANMSYYKYKPPLDQYRREIGKRGLAKWIKECANNPKVKDFTPYKKR